MGRIKRSVESATAKFEASEEDRVDVMITMYAEVAFHYINVRTLQSRLQTAAGNIESQREVLKLSQTRFENGLASRLDVVQAESVLATSESQVPPLRIELARAINTLAVLLGKMPGFLDKRLAGKGPIHLPPGDVAVGVPADLLRQRPDIRRAERLLAAQIGVAEADLYPRFGLNGSIGFKSPSLGDALSLSNLGLSFGLSFRWNLFDGGKVRSQIKVENALTEQALIRYESTVLNALNEAENAMVAFWEQRIQYEALARSLNANHETLRLATGLYKDGLVSFQGGWTPSAAFFHSQPGGLVPGQRRPQHGQAYKTLGGGWDPEELDKPHR